MYVYIYIYTLISIIMIMTYIYIYIYIYYTHIYIYIGTREDYYAQQRGPSMLIHRRREVPDIPNPPTKIVDFRGFDSSVISI